MLVSADSRLRERAEHLRRVDSGLTFAEAARLLARESEELRKDTALVAAAVSLSYGEAVESVCRAVETENLERVEALRIALDDREATHLIARCLARAASEGESHGSR